MTHNRVITSIIMFKGIKGILDAIDKAFPDPERMDLDEFKKEWLGE